MTILRPALLVAVILCLVVPTVEKGRAQSLPRTNARALVYDVRAFGARGDGKTLDTSAINRAIEAAAAAGGGRTAHARHVSRTRHGSGRDVLFTVASLTGALVGVAVLALSALGCLV